MEIIIKVNKILMRDETNLQLDILIRSRQHIFLIASEKWSICDLKSAKSACALQLTYYCFLKITVIYTVSFYELKLMNKCVLLLVKLRQKSHNSIKVAVSLNISASFKASHSYWIFYRATRLGLDSLAVFKRAETQM